MDYTTETHSTKKYSAESFQKQKMFLTKNNPLKMFDQNTLKKIWHKILDKKKLKCIWQIIIRQTNIFDKKYSIAILRQKNSTAVKL